MRIFDSDGKFRFSRSTLETMMKRAKAVAEGPELTISVETMLAIEEPKGVMVDQAEAAKEAIVAALAPLDPEARRRTMARLRGQFDAGMRKLLVDRAIKQDRVALLKDEIAALEELENWDPPLVLERNDCSRLHHIKQRLRDCAGWDDRHEVIEPSARERYERVENTFVVKHDWAKAFENAKDFEGEFQMPFDLSCYEFRVGGRTVVLLYDMRTKPEVVQMAIEVGPLWYFPPGCTAQQEPLYRFLHEQVRAICIAMDAEVATRTVVRRPRSTRNGSAPASRRCWITTWSTSRTDTASGTPHVRSRQVARSGCTSAAGTGATTMITAPGSNGS